MSEKVLITGGAGYIGSVLCRLLISEGYHVRVLDRLLFGGESVIELLNYSNFEFINGDTRIKEDREKAVMGMNYIIHLAAIVGDPACSKNSDLTKETNIDATKLLYEEANAQGCKRFVFASTCSNYGKMKDPDKMVDENSELRPVSLYAETKVAAEFFLLEQNRDNICKPICLRFATAYGLSPRMRFDLTVNEFIRDTTLGKELKIFGEQFWRPYCHIIDLARACIMILRTNEEKISFNVFNVGDSGENYQKKMIAEEILKIIPAAKISYFKKDEDPRDYKVNFEKIKNALGFKITRKLPDGLRNVHYALINSLFTNPYKELYSNS
ncbi:MAG: SDR family oxidoreductase [Bacteroidales bacterium]